MANKSKSSAKSKKATKKQSMANRQIQAIVMFTVAVLSLFVLIIEGQHVWKFMHDFLFGMFGLLSILHQQDVSAPWRCIQQGYPQRYY
mgnify:CR=1 FL=1